MALGGLATPGVSVWGLRRKGELVGCGALKELSVTDGEIKSMHTLAAHRGTGVAKTMLLFLIEEGRRRNYRNLLLETGTSPAYAPARTLYAANGFIPCGPFGSYVDDPESAYFTLTLQD